ncbi:MAG: ATP-grasp fold amidoligase family protein [Prevotella sp.]|nr:ATP-grasp fold amidoligase family protein [Prevotella sp.]
MKKIILTIVELLCKLHLLTPIKVARLRYYYKFHKWPNFENPHDLNEKINWLKFYGDTSKWADLADKYKARDYVESLGLGDILVRLYGKWDKANMIDWDSLPNQFVLKVNNGCGDVLICKDRTKLEKEATVKLYNKLVTSKYGDVSGEPHYARITPCIIAEELLDITKQPIQSSSLIDYKVWCLNGKPFCIWCAWNRRGHSADTGIYDTDWNYHPEWSVFSRTFKEGDTRLPKPQNLNKMLDVASRLSTGFPILRVDLYEVDGKVYFGELTFTSLGGFMDYLTPEILQTMGEMVKLGIE